MTISNEGSAQAAHAQPATTGSNGAVKTKPEGLKKLHGRAFYESIGSPKFVLAPMVDQSEFAWRLLTRSFMTPESNQKLVAYTPMFHARMFAEQAKFRDRMFQPRRTPWTSSLPSPPDLSPPELDIYLDGNPACDRPLFVQFCANNPDELLAAAKYVAPFCDAVDLNLGCPQGIARRGMYGAFLQEDQELIFTLINNLHVNLSVPVTAKIRILETKEKTLAYAQNVLKAGASILTVHGRQREQKGHKTGLADWSVIRFLRENLPAETVLFANGNILKREDIDACLEATGADGVMSAEGNLYDPAIFAEAPEVGHEGREYWRGNDGKGGYRMDAVLRRYLDIMHQHVLEQPLPTRQPLYIPSDGSLPEKKLVNNTEPTTAEDANDGQPPKKKQKRERTKNQDKVTSPNLSSMQPHLFHLLRALVSKQHHVRDSLAKCRTGNIDAFEHVLHLVEVACARGIKEYAETDGKSWEEEIVRDEVEKAKKIAEQMAARERERSGLVQTKGGADGNGNGAKNQEEVITTKNSIPEAVNEAVDDGMDESSVETVRACRRPWWVVQPYVRPLPKEALAIGGLTLSKKERRALEGGVGVHTTDVNPQSTTNGKDQVEKVKVKEMEKGEVDIGGDGVSCGHVDVEIVNAAVDAVYAVDKNGNTNGDVKCKEKETIEIPKDGLVCG